MKRLDIEQLRSALSRVQATLPVPFQMRLEQHPHEGVVLVVEIDVPDSYHEGEIQHQRINTYVPPFHDEAAFFAYLEYRLERIVSHEVREGFFVDGERLYDPHRDFETIMDQ